MALFNLKKSSKPDKVKEPKNVTAIQATNDFIRASKEFEQSRIGDIEKSRTWAWRVATATTACAIMSSVAVMGLTPLKEVRPYVIRVDNNTGATDIVNTLSNTKENYSEAVSKFFASQYVRLLESYDWYTIQSQVNQALMFSDSNMQGVINQKFASPTAPHKIYKDQQRINVKINNVSIIDPKGVLQVRFTTTVENVGGGLAGNQNTNTPSAVAPITNHIATIAYDYVNVPTLDSVRLVNPLGFTVKSYRVDDDNSQVTKPTTPTQVQGTTPEQVAQANANAVPNATVQQTTQTTTQTTTAPVTATVTTNGGAK